MKTRARWRRNKRLKCDCGGWWFPHRHGSMANPEGRAAQQGYRGCHHGKVRHDFSDAPAVPYTPGTIPF